jgi:hypothetical protein
MTARTVGLARNFICPMTEVACTDGNCRIGKCQGEERERVRQTKLKEADRDRLMRGGLPAYTAEELGF